MIPTILWLEQSEPSSLYHKHAWRPCHVLVMPLICREERSFNGMLLDFLNRDQALR